MAVFDLSFFGFEDLLGFCDVMILISVNLGVDPGRF